MPDFCVVCGDAEAGEAKGEYIEFHNSKYNVYIDRFMCYSCMGEGRIHYD